MLAEKRPRIHMELGTLLRQSQRAACWWTVRNTGHCPRRTESCRPTICRTNGSGLLPPLSIYIKFWGYNLILFLPSLSSLSTLFQSQGLFLLPWHTHKHVCVHDIIPKYNPFRPYNASYMHVWYRQPIGVLFPRKAASSFPAVLSCLQLPV